MSRVALPGFQMENRIFIRPGERGIASLFQPGEILEGKILRKIDPHHAILQLKGKTLRVETRVPLPADFGLFEVESAVPPITLRLVGSAEEESFLGQELLRKGLSRDIPLEQLAEAISDLLKLGADEGRKALLEPLGRMIRAFEGFSMDEPASLDPETLFQRILCSGLFLERKLADASGFEKDGGMEALLANDLKSVAFHLIGELRSLFENRDVDSESRRAARTIERDLEHLIQKMELYQLFNLTWAEDGAGLLLIPVWFGGRLQFVELGLSLPSSKEGTHDEGISLLFLLHLPDLGRMRIEVKLREKGLFGFFRVSNQEIEAWMKQHLAALAQRLREVGFEANLSVSVEASGNEPPSLIAGMVAEKPLGFSVVV